MHMAQSRRHEHPRSSRLQHSASFRAGNPNKASMTLMLAAASICAADALERHLVPPGCECCERELLGRSWRRDWGMRNFTRFLPVGDPTADREKLSPIGCSGLVFGHLDIIYFFMWGTPQQKVIHHTFGGPPTYPQHPIHKKNALRTHFVRSGKMLEKCAWPNLDAMSVPEALVYTILHHFARRARIKHP